MSKNHVKTYQLRSELQKRDSKKQAWYNTNKDFTLAAVILKIIMNV